MATRLLVISLLAAAWLERAPLVHAMTETERQGSVTEERLPHPEPRVIVNVVSVRGPHDPERVQREARQRWSQLVRCYKSFAGGRRVTMNFELAIAAAGKVTGVKPVEVNPKDGDLAACVAAAFSGIEMPVASADSVAEIEIRLAPGDRPMPKEDRE